MASLIAAAVLLQVQVRQEAKDWRLLETPHFRVYYPSDDLLPRARQFAGWFEDAHAELSRRLSVEPPVLNVFLYRGYHDLQQSSFLGRYRPLHERVRSPVFDDRPGPSGPKPCSPRAHSRALALAEPLRDRIFIHCQPSDRWNYWFVKHELVHHMQYAHLYPWRIPSWLITLKDPIIPAWWWEGGADYFAGAFDSRKDEFVRDLAVEGLYDLKILHTPDILNPHDYMAIYHEGAYFWKFLEEAYGPDMPARLFARTDHGLPIASQKPLQAVTGKPRAQVEREFAAHWNARWTALLDGRGEPAERLTDSREYYRRRSWGGRWSPDGARLAWISDHDVWPNLVVDGRGVLAGDRGNTGARIVSPPTWSPDGRRIAVVEQINHRDRLTLVDVGSGAVETIDLAFDELFDPAWSPDGRRIAFAAMKSGTADLYALSLADGTVERLTDDPAGDLMPAWSRDGRLCWIKDVEGRTVLHVLGRGAVTRSWALLEYPRWSADGRSIVVAADVGGVYDAFAVDPETGRAKRLTRFRGGVSHPDPHPDGSLAITYFQGRGTDLWRVRPEPQDEPGFDQEDRKPWYDRFKSPEPLGEPAEKSRVWGVDFLQFPVISQSLTTPGLEFQFGDRDAENALMLFGTATSNDAWAATATVVNTRWRPTIGASAGAFETDELRELSARGFVEFPLWTTLAVGGGWAVRERTQIEEDFDDPSFFDSGPFVSAIYSNRAGYQLRDRAWGVAFGGTATVFEDDLGGDRDQTEYFAFGESAFDLAQDWIVWTRVTYEKLVTRILLQEELLDVDGLVRGAETREGIERGSVSLELRFPLWRDFLWMPLELIGLGEWLVLKDLRGFAFGQAGYAGFDFENAWDDDFGVVSTGLGLRLDVSAMVWPVVNLRVPLRMEGWWALVGADEEDPRGEVGVGLTIGY